MKKDVLLKSAFLFSLAFGLLCPVVAAQETKAITLKTFYPEPIAAFDRLRLTPQTDIGTTCDIGELSLKTSVTSGNLTTNDVLYACFADGVGSGGWRLNQDVWTYSNSADHDIFLSDFANTNLKVGIGTTTPIFKLTLDNDGSMITTGVTDEGSIPGDLDEGMHFAWLPSIASFAATDFNDSTSNVSGYSYLWISPITNSSGYAMGTSDRNNDYQKDFSTSKYSISLGLNTCTPKIGGVKIGHNQYSNYSTTYSVITGGYGNGLIGTNGSVIGGGNGQSIYSTDFSFIGGGDYNIILTGYTQGKNSVVLGGQVNLILDENGSVIGGGKNNLLRSSSSADKYNLIIGGESSAIFYGYYNVIGGGKQNVCGSLATSGTSYSTIIGGYRNFIDFPSASSAPGPSYSTIIGGTGNIVSARFATIGGGQGNALSQEFGTIIGGQGHTMNFNPQADPETSRYSTIVGGQPDTSVSPPVGHEITSGLSFIGGGYQHKLRRNADSGRNGVILGGYQNRCSVNCFIGGGYKNAVGASTIWTNFDNASTSIDGNGSIILGGAGNTSSTSSSPCRSWVGGKNMTLTAALSFLWGHSAAALSSTGTATINFIIRTGRVGIQTLSPQYTLDVNGTMSTGTGKVFLAGMPVAAAGSYPAAMFDASGNLGYDLAEVFEVSGEKPEPGDVMVIDPAHAPAITKSSSPYDQKVIGIISSVPAITLEGSRVIMGTYPPEDDPSQKKVALALKGRVAVKVTLENGPITIGDALTTSSVPGRAMKASEENESFGTTLGKALEPFSGGPNGETEGTITAFVAVH